MHSFHGCMCVHIEREMGEKEGGSEEEKEAETKTLEREMINERKY